MSVIIFLVIGAIFAILGIYTIISAVKKKSRCTQIVVGKVIEIETEENYERIDDTEYYQGGSFRRTYGPSHYRIRVSHYPIYQYVVNGEQYITKAKIASSMGRLMIGKAGNIYYNPTNPEDCYIQGEANKSIFGGVIMIIVGVIAAIMGIVVVNN